MKPIPRMMQLFKFLFVFVTLMSGFTSFVYAGESHQNPLNHFTESSLGQGRITIRQSPEMEALVTRFVDNNRSLKGIEGYRIQIYSGTGATARQEAQELRSRVLSHFPDERIIVEYNAPFWRVRVGSYRHKHEALPLLRKIQSSFPNAYVVREPYIKIDEFKK